MWSHFSLQILEGHTMSHSTTDEQNTSSGCAGYEDTFMTSPRSDSDMQESSSDNESEVKYRKAKYRRTMKCLKMLNRLYSEPIAWDMVDHTPKTNLMQAVMEKVTHRVNPDIFVRVADAQYGCHLIVLQTYSSTFLQFECGMTVYLPVDQVLPNIFPLIYEWMLQEDDYTTQILKRGNVLDILKAASYLKVTELEEQCWAFVDSYEAFNEETALLLYTEASIKGNRTVKDMMLHRICNAFQTLIRTNDFRELPLEVICALLQSNYISLHNEMEVFDAAIEWLSYDWITREQYVIDIMKCIRFGFMQPHELVHMLRSQQDIRKTRVVRVPAVTDLIRQAAEYAVVRCTYANNREELQQEFNILGLEELEQRNWIVPDKHHQLTTNDCLPYKYIHLHEQVMVQTDVVGADTAHSDCQSNQCDSIAEENFTISARNDDTSDYSIGSQNNEQQESEFGRNQECSENDKSLKNSSHNSTSYSIAAGSMNHLKFNTSLAHQLTTIPVNHLPPTGRQCPFIDQRHTIMNHMQQASDRNIQ